MHFSKKFSKRAFHCRTDTDAKKLEINYLMRSDVSSFFFLSETNIATGLASRMWFGDFSFAALLVITKSNNVRLLFTIEFGSNKISN